jgi:hypothetical protein
MKNHFLFCLRRFSKKDSETSEWSETERNKASSSSGVKRVDYQNIRLAPTFQLAPCVIDLEWYADMRLLLPQRLYNSQLNPVNNEWVIALIWDALCPYSTGFDPFVPGFGDQAELAFPGCSNLIYQGRKWAPRGREEADEQRETSYITLLILRFTHFKARGEIPWKTN